jgi:hypothetical protein
MLQEAVMRTKIALYDDLTGIGFSVSGKKRRHCLPKLGITLLPSLLSFISYYINRMLYNLPLLSTHELQHLFVAQGKRFMDGLHEKKPFSELGVIRDALQQMYDELAVLFPGFRLRDIAVKTSI